MKREEAIEKIKDIKSLVEKYDDVVALRMAIEALKQEQEPCEDAVSKKAVLGLFNKSDMRSWEMSLLKREIEEIPPVKPVACIAKITFSKEDMQKFVNEKIKEITVEQEQRWIPVKEKLPEESLNSVIGWDAYRERCVFVQYIDGYFQITGRDESFNITAWMPLPEPYKPEKESE